MRIFKRKIYERMLDWKRTKDLSLFGTRRRPTISSYSSWIGSRYLLYTKDLHKDEQTVMLPVMMAMFL